MEAEVSFPILSPGGECEVACILTCLFVCLSVHAHNSKNIAQIDLISITRKSIRMALPSSKMEKKYVMMSEVRHSVYLLSSDVIL